MKKTQLRSQKEIAGKVARVHDVVRVSREALSRVLTRIGGPERADPVDSYVDRKGKVRWPYQAALELAQKFCTAATERSGRVR
jgi:hypothetical protein